MIKNNIAHWRSTMNNGAGISQSHFARRVGVGRSFVSKLEKGKGQPGAEFMLRAARYFKQPVETIFHEVAGKPVTSAIICSKTIP
jgi:transcriptional regulator with XRE-family HTH domain